MKRFLSEKFNPSGHKSFEELPDDQKSNFVPVEDGFVSKEAFEHEKEWKGLAREKNEERSFFQKLMKTNYTDFTDLAMAEARKLDREESRDAEQRILRAKYEAEFEKMSEETEVLEMKGLIEGIRSGIKQEDEFDCLQFEAIIIKFKKSPELFRRGIIDLDLNNFKPENRNRIIGSLINSLKEIGVSNVGRIVLILKYLKGLELIDSNLIYSMILDKIDEEIKFKINKQNYSPENVERLVLGYLAGTHPEGMVDQGLTSQLKNINLNTFNRLLDLNKYQAKEEKGIASRLTRAILASAENFSISRKEIVQALIDNFGVQNIRNYMMDLKSLEGLDNIRGLSIETVLSDYLRGQSLVFYFKKFLELPNFEKIVKNLISYQVDEQKKKKILEKIAREIYEVYKYEEMIAVKSALKRHGESPTEEEVKSRIMEKCKIIFDRLDSKVDIDSLIK